MRPERHCWGLSAKGLLVISGREALRNVCTRNNSKRLIALSGAKGLKRGYS